MKHRDLVPVQHHLQVRAAGDARDQVERYAQRHGELVSIVPDPAKPYRDGDSTVAVVATIYEPAAAQPRRWDRILWAAAALVLACVLLVAAIVDVYLLVGALILAGLMAAAYHGDKASKR